MRRCDVIWVFIVGKKNRMVQGTHFAMRVFVVFEQVDFRMIHFKCINLNSCLCRTAIRHSFARNKCLSTCEKTCNCSSLGSNSMLTTHSLGVYSPITTFSAEFDEHFFFDRMSVIGHCTPMKAFGLRIDSAKYSGARK